MSPKECPCKDCVPPKRSPTCHSTCPDYKEWKGELDERNAEIKKAKDEQIMLDDYRIRGAEKAKWARERSKGKCKWAK